MKGASVVGLHQVNSFLHNSTCYLDIISILCHFALFIYTSKLGKNWIEDELH